MSKVVNFALEFMLLLALVALGLLAWPTSMGDCEPFVAGFIGVLLPPVLGMLCMLIGLFAGALNRD